MTPPGPRRSQEQRSPGIRLRRQPGLQRLREGQQSPRPRLTPWGSVRGAHRVLWVPFMSAPKRTPAHVPTHRSTHAPRRANKSLGGLQKPPQLGRGQAGAGKPKGPGEGAATSQKSRPSCRPRPRSEAVDRASSLSTPLLRRPPFPSSNLSGLTHRVS